MSIEPIKQLKTKDPIPHARNIAMHLNELKNHCYADIELVNNPRAQALFETAAKVLDGLEKAFHDFEIDDERAWKKGQWKP